MPAAWVRQQSAALLHADEDSQDGAALEFRDLSIEASYRSAPAILDVVDAVIADVGYRNMGLPDPPNRASRPFPCPSRHRWSCGSPSPSRTTRNGEEGEEGWLGEDARHYAERSG